MDRHNLRHTARIGALGALLLLLQACGGGSSGNRVTLPMTEDDCTGTTPIFESTEVPCQMAETNAQCLARNATTPIRNTDGSCEAQVQSDCDGTNTPVLDTGACRVAVDAADCALANSARPIFVSAMSCRPAEQADCDGTNMPVLDNGACRAVEVPAGTAFTVAPDPDNHAQYLAVAGNLPLFVDGNSAQVTSVTLGSIGVADGSNVRTNDRVGLGGPRDVAQIKETSGVFIDVGNDGDDLNNDADPGPDTESIEDLTGNGFETTNAGRRTTELGESGDASNPVWAYRTATFTKSTPLSLAAPDAAGEYRAFVVDWSGDANNYMGGGVWARVYNDENSMLRTAVGAFVDGRDPTEDSEIDAVDADTEATYYGHAYGRYSLNTGIAGDANPGFFAAKAELTADFGALNNEPGTISGRIHNFIFSTANTFVATTEESALEDAIGGRDRFAVTLLGEDNNITGDPPQTPATNSFGGAAEGSRIQLPGGEMIDPVGQWGGRFYGTPTDGDAPELVGGVFAVAGATGTGTDDVSFSIIGSFGAKLPPPSPP